MKVSKCSGGFAELNVLWDCGSTLSFITFQQARQFKLVGEKICIKIVKVGGVVKELDSFRYSITLVDKLGSVIKIIVLGMSASLLISKR